MSKREGRGDVRKKRSDEPRVIASTSISTRARTGLTIFAVLYLATIWLEEGIGSSFPGKITPRVWIYFAQIAALFQSAGDVAIDYRAEGWSCADKKWVEVDTRPWFEIDSDNKENRFHRTLRFYRKERVVMNALEDYIVARHNAVPSHSKIGGVRFLSLRIPYPKLGEHVERRAAERQDLASYPSDVRHFWFHTPKSRRQERCSDRKSLPKEDDDGTPIVKRNAADAGLDPDASEPR